MYRTHHKQGAAQSRYIMFTTDPGRRPAYEHAVPRPGGALSSIKISDTRSLAQCVPRTIDKEMSSPCSRVNAPHVRAPHEQQPLDLSVKRPRLANKHLEARHHVVNEHGHLINAIALRDQQVRERHSANHSRESRREMTRNQEFVDAESIRAQRAAWALMVKHRQDDQQRARLLERDAIRSAMIEKSKHHHQRAAYDHLQVNRKHNLSETLPKAPLSGLNTVKMMYKCTKKDVSKYDINRTQRLELQRPHVVKRTYQANEPRENAKIKEFSPVKIALVAPRKKECTQNEKRQNARTRSDDPRIRHTAQTDMVRGRTYFPPVMSVNDMLSQLPESYQTTSPETHAALLQTIYARARASTDPAAFGLINNSMAAGKKINKLLKSLNSEKSIRSESAKFCVASRGGLKGIHRQQMEEVRRARIRDGDGMHDHNVVDFQEFGSVEKVADSPQASLTPSSNPMYFNHLTLHRSGKERRRTHSQTPAVGSVIASTKSSSKSDARTSDRPRIGGNRYQVVINKKHQPIKLSVTPPVSNQMPTKTVSVKNLSVSTATSPQSIQPAPPSIIPKRMAEKRMRHAVHVHNRHRDESTTAFPTSPPGYTHSPKAGTLPNAIHDYYYSNPLFGGNRTTESDPLGEMIRAELERKGIPNTDSSSNGDHFPTTMVTDSNRSSRDEHGNARIMGRVNMTLSELARRDMLKKQFKLSGVEPNGDRKSVDQDDMCSEKMNNRRLREESLRGLALEGLHNPSKLSNLTSPLTSPIADQPSPPMPVLTPQRTAHPDEERVRSGDSPIPILKDARNEGPNATMPLSPSTRHELKSTQSSFVNEERVRSNLQHRFDVMKPPRTISTSNSSSSDRATGSTMSDGVYRTEKVNYGESVTQGTKEALQEIFREANDQVISYYRHMRGQSLNEEDHNIFSRLKHLREDVASSSGKSGSKRRKAMEVIDLTDSRDASPSPVHGSQSTNRKTHSPGLHQNPLVVEPGICKSVISTVERSELNSAKEYCHSESLKDENGSDRLPHDSPFRKVYRGMKQRILPATYPKAPSPDQDKFTARFSDPNALRLPKDVSKQSVIVAKTVWPSSTESERVQTVWPSSSESVRAKTVWPSAESERAKTVWPSAESERAQTVWPSSAESERAKSVWPSAESERAQAVWSSSAEFERAKTVWPSAESERLSFTSVGLSEVRDIDDAVDYFGRSGPEQLEDVSIPAIRFPQSEDTPDLADPIKPSRTPSVSPRRDVSQMLDVDVDRMEQRLKNVSPTVTTLTGETIIKPPRKRPLEMCRLANSEGFVAEVKGQKHEDLLTDSVSLDREERALKEREHDWPGVDTNTKHVPLNRRAILQFNQMEAKEKIQVTSLDDGSESRTVDTTGDKYADGDQEPGPEYTDDTDDCVFPANDEANTNGHVGAKCSTVVPIRRTRNAGARLGSAQKPYNKNARYEQEIEKERAKYWERRRQRSTSVSVSEDDSPPTKRRGRPPKTDNERKGSNSSNAQIASERIKMKYKGCGRGKYPRVRKLSIDSRKSFDVENVQNNNQQKITSEYDAETITEEVPMAVDARRKSSTSSAGKRSMRCVVDPCNPHKMKFVAMKTEEVATTPTGRKRKMKTKHLDDGGVYEWTDGAEADEERDFGEENDVIKTEEETQQFQLPEPPPDFRKILANKKLGETILHRAARLGYDDVAIYCVEYCILDINAKDNAGYTALHECCVHGRIKIAHKLLCHGADVNAGAVDGTRPIHDAVDNDQVEMVRLLLSFGADPLLATYSGRTTLKLARSKDVRTLLYGFLTDINGTWEMGEDEEALTDNELRWQFNGTCSLFDDPTNSGYNIFEDIPGPDSDTEDNLELDLELSDSPHLVSFNIQVDPTKGPRNWCRLSDVCQTVSIPRDQFENMHPTIHIVRVHGDELKQSIRESQIMTSCVDDVNDKDQVELVELNDDVRKLLDLETVGIR